MKVREIITYLDEYINEGNSPNDEFELIAKLVYDKLHERLDKLRKLEAYGVDNWQYYSEAINSDE